MKHCNGCLLTKPLEEFNKRMKRGKQVPRSRCRPCEKVYQLNAYISGGRKNTPPYRRHGLTKDQYDSMVNSQQGICANDNCVRPAVVIDHDHSCCPSKYSCGQCVRGLLCSGCNTAEGLAGSVEVLQGLINYLNKHKEKV